MAKKYPPGWYPTNDGTIARWDGRNWTGETQPAGPPNGAVGWHLEREGLYRWWLGDHWSPARAAADGRIDIVNCVGQTLLEHVLIMGASTADPVTMLRADLPEYPPSRIDVMTSHPSAILKGTTLVTVLSWDGPAAS